MKKKYIHFAPRGDAQKGNWAKNVNEKIVTYGPLVGLDAATITKIQTAAQNISTTVETVEVKKKDLEEAVSAKNESLKTDMQLIQTYAAIIKRHPDYKEQIGSALGFIGTTAVYDEKDLQPNITARAFEGKIEVGFDLQMMNCITIFSRLKGATVWIRLGNDYESPFIDERPLTTAGQSEVREYAAMYFNGKEEVGLMSQIETIAFAG